MHESIEPTSGTTFPPFLLKIPAIPHILILTKFQKPSFPPPGR
jgi:hypothetical protein